MLRYALTIFVSAFLLFQVQPLTGRFILPWFGGGPSIWTACMLFFQLLLLGGYLYSHLLSTLFRPRTQAIVHLTLLIGSLAFLPISPSESWKPTAGESPLSTILLLLTATVGAPYFLLSTTGPLMQRWFSRTAPGQSPYRLYALSNVGSLLALLSYPFVFEPWLPLRQQVNSWSGLYSLYAGLAALCAFGILRQSGREDLGVADSGAAAPRDESQVSRPGIGSLLLWLLLSASSSVMLLATTNQLCIDVATVPFLWILPLSLYLISFILCFDSPRWYDRRVYALLLLVCCPLASQVLSDGPDASISWQILVYSVVLFACCMSCHGELYQLRPHSRWLTLYFVVISAGGALGGLFVAMAAPRLFVGYWEYHVGLWACALAVVLALATQRVWLRTPSPGFWIWTLAAAAQFAGQSWLVLNPLAEFLSSTQETILLGGFCTILVAGLLLTGALEPLRNRVLVGWLTVSLLQVSWIFGYLRWTRPFLLLPGALSPEGGDVVVETSWLMQSPLWQRSALASLLPALVAAIGFWGILKLSERGRRWLIPGLLYAASVVLLWAAVSQGWLAQQRFNSILATAIAGILMDLSARGFRGPARPSPGLSLLVPAVTLLLILGLRLKEVTDEGLADTQVVHVSRNFYGVLRVRYDDADGTVDEDQDPLPGKYSLTHGQIRHGFQFDDDYWARQPTTYYGRESGLGRAIVVARERAMATDGHALRVGVVGLGTGTIAAFGHPGEQFRFYDINPDVLALSEQGIFKYLKNCEANLQVVLGDARIMMEHELAQGASQQFDVLAIDAFSSDAIPVHLLTTECAEIYGRHLRPGGILAVHISNRFLDLAPVTRGLAEHLAWKAVEIDNADNDATGVFSSTWVLLSSSAEVLEDPLIQEASAAVTGKERILRWTDDYSGLWQVLSF